jgi:cyclopropane fatty-acyl-phospholipid synthase-like methyltransferase
VKPYSEACERNRDPILDVLRVAFADAREVLEIGSGTGQHAVYFARHLPHLTWHASDVAEHHAGINAWIAEAALPNLRAPVALDVREERWPVAAGSVDGVFSANTLHIMDWGAVEAFFRGVASVLKPGGVLAVYGPFNDGGQFTAPSNARFDAMLRARGEGSALRDVEAVDALARGIGLARTLDAPMPANNRTLVWRRAENAPAVV